jgi:molybdopterin-containing oxidoreductase family membrane subunit
VAGAIYSGFAMVLTLMIPCRAIFRLKAVITDAHYDAMAKMLLVTGWIVTYTYLLEQFLAWYSGDPYEYAEMFKMRPAGDYAVCYWVMIFCNCIVLQLLWIPAVRRNVVLLWLISLLVNVGMWMERFIIIVTSLYHDFLPSSWHHYTPTWVDFSLLFGSMSFFMWLFLLFIKFVPFIPITEMKDMRHEMAKEAAVAA